MNFYLNNFAKLFSSDNKVVYDGLLEKKDWINHVFYVDYSFAQKIVNGKEIYEDLFSLLNNSLLLKSDKSKNFSYRYFNLIPRYIKKEGHFLVKIDLRKLDDKAYRELFANFYKCIKKEDKVIFENEIQNELEKIMISDNDYVLILDNSLLINYAYPLYFFTEIIYDSAYIDKLKLDALKEIASSFNIEVKEISNYE